LRGSTGTKASAGPNLELRDRPSTPCGKMPRVATSTWSWHGRSTAWGVACNI
jgi:hypothetical protein